MNKVILMGRITQDLELKTFKDTIVLKFTLAVRRDKEKTDFINCIAFNKTAETINKFFKKGSMIVIGGKIQTGSYEKDNKKVYTFDININEFFFCESSKESTPSKNVNSQNNSTNNLDLEVDDNDLPF